MNRDEFIDFLARLIADGLLTEDKATELIREFDAGTLADGWELPLPPERAIRERDDTAIATGIAIFLLLLGRQPGQPIPDRISVGGTIVNTIQAQFERQVRQLATQLASNQITIAQWQAQMIAQMQQHMAQQMAAASGLTTLNARQLQTMNRIMQEQTAFLSRFADEIAGRQGLGSPFSEAYLANRAEQYGGVGRGLFYQESELSLLERAEIGPDVVIDYESRDDRRTCSPCLEAERNGPYLPGQGPMPGEVCLGRNRCRCVRRPRADAQAYAELTGRALA